MSKVKIKTNKKEIANFLRSKDVQELLTERAKTVAGRAGIDTEQDILELSGRAVAGVFSSRDPWDDDANRRLMEAIND